MSSRTILHLNVVNFYIAVARSLNRTLNDRPVAVAASGLRQPVLLDVSAEARAAGIQRGMTVANARRLCHDLAITAPLPAEVYDRAHNALMRETKSLSPDVEPAGYGHVFVDLSGTQRLLGNATGVAEQLHATILKNYRFNSAVGLAANKLVSKIATRVVKPFGLCTVINGSERDFLAPLPIAMLPGIDSRSLRHLQQFNIRSIGELCTIEPDHLTAALGSVALELLRRAQGIDSSPVAETLSKSVIMESVILDQQTNDDLVLQSTILELSQRVGRLLRRIKRSTSSIVMTITYADDKIREHHNGFLPPTNIDLNLFCHMWQQFRAMHDRRVRIKKIGITIPEYGLPATMQMSLFDNDTNGRDDSLMQAIDEIRDRFGFGFGGGISVGSLTKSVKSE